MTTPPEPPSSPPPPPPPPPAGGPPEGYANNDEKTWTLIAHFGGPLGVFVLGGLGGWVAPLVAMVSKGNQSATVRAHAVSALNFQITWAGAMLIAIILAVCTLGILFFVPLLVALVPIIFGIIGGVKANEGAFYNYPLAIKLIK